MTAAGAVPLPPLAEVMEATWPPAARRRQGPWCIRDGQGGGKRVSAATAEAEWRDEDIAGAEQAMWALNQPALFLIRDQDAMLDQALQSRGYRIVDPVIAYQAPVAGLCDPAPGPMTSFAHWPPLAVCADLWAEGGIGPERRAVMDRAAGPKCAILARTDDRPAGCAFVALHGRVAMLHALEVSPRARRQGSAKNLLRAAAIWAQAQGADTLSLVVTRANAAARALYVGLGMQEAGHYHYRQEAPGTR